MRLIRKLFVFLSCALILICAALPASAAERFDANAMGYNSSAPIDYVVLNDGSSSGCVFTWPGNHASSDSQLFESVLGYANVSVQDNKITTDALFADASNITLHTDFWFILGNFIH